MFDLKPKLKTRMAQANGLKTLSIDVTKECNMSCGFCYAMTFKRAEDAELKDFKRLFKEAFEMGVCHYIFQGGEPIAYPERLKYMLKHCFPEESYINVVSNGWAMSLDKILWLKKLKVDKIAFSLDSGIEYEHDRNRQTGSYKKVLHAITDTINAGLLASFSIVVTHESLHSNGFFSAYELACRLGIRMDVQIAMPVGGLRKSFDLMLTPSDIDFIDTLRKNAPLLSNGQELIHRDLFGPFNTKCCPAGKSFMAVSSSGEIMPCNFCQFTLGNIKTTSLKTARDRLLLNSWFRDRHPDCIVGENLDFRSKFLLPNINRVYPLNIREVMKV